MAKRGKFIVVDGINACGKTTQIKNLWDLIYVENNIPLITTFEPNEKISDYGKKAREILKSVGDPYSKAIEAIEAFSKDRNNHNKSFAHNLSDGYYVLTGRYWYSTFAYQHAQCVSYKNIAENNKGLIVPDLTLILDVTVEESWRRRRKEKRRKFDSDYDFMESVRKNYLELPTILPKLMNDSSIRVIDGMGTEDEVWERIHNVVKKEDILTT